MVMKRRAGIFPSELQPHNFKSFLQPAEGLSGL